MAIGKRGREGDDDARSARGWEGAPSTDFAITTVNVPDRLDMQELRARGEDEDRRPRPRRSLRVDGYTVRVWLGRLLVPVLLAALLFVGYRTVEPIKEDLAAPRIAERLTKGTGQRVTVAESSLEFTRAPRLVLRQVEVAGLLRLEEVGLHFSWEEAVRALRGGTWAWGELTVPSLDLSHDQVFALVDALPALTAALPPSVSVVRLASVGFPDFPLLPGRYEVTLRRQDDRRFGSVVLETTSGDGRMSMRLTPRAGGQVAFQLESAGWRAPVGPTIPWISMVASGYFGPRFVVVETYSGFGAFGTVQGSAAAGVDREWVLTGTGRAGSINLESLFRHLHGAGQPGSPEESRLRVPLSGLATADVRWVGRAATLSDAIGGAVFGGSVDVRYAQLNGINLGLAATQGNSGGGGGGGGLTRFTDLAAVLAAAGGKIAFTDIYGRAGALTARGEIVTGPDLSLIGSVRVELGTSRVVAPFSLRVRGSVLAPEFVR